MKYVLLWRTIFDGGAQILERDDRGDYRYYLDVADVGKGRDIVRGLNELERRRARDRRERARRARLRAGR